MKLSNRDIVQSFAEGYKESLPHTQVKKYLADIGLAPIGKVYSRSKVNIDNYLFDNHEYSYYHNDIWNEFKNSPIDYQQELSTKEIESLSDLVEIMMDITATKYVIDNYNSSNRYIKTDAFSEIKDDIQYNKISLQIPIDWFDIGEQEDLDKAFNNCGFHRVTPNKSFSCYLLLRYESAFKINNEEKELTFLGKSSNGGWRFGRR